MDSRLVSIYIGGAAYRSGEIIAMLVERRGRGRAAVERLSPAEWQPSERAYTNTSPDMWPSRRDRPIPSGEHGFVLEGRPPGKTRERFSDVTTTP